MITKDDLISLFTPEIAITTKVLKAIPEGQLDFSPHDRSSSVKTQISTLAVGMVMNMSFLRGEEPSESMDQVQKFDTVEVGIAEFEKKAKEFMNALAAAPAEDLEKPLSMWGMDRTRGEFLMMLLMDMIHHRGQLSVYVRLAGGKVPSIYGPSADEGSGA